MTMAVYEPTDDDLLPRCQHCGALLPSHYLRGCKDACPVCRGPSPVGDCSD